MLDRHGEQLGSAIVTLVTIAPASDETLPVTVRVLDGSTINGAPVSGELAGVIPARPGVASATTVSDLGGTLTGCSVTQSSLVLLADGVVFGSLHTSCADSLLLAGRAGTGGLSTLTLDSFAGSPVAHLLLNVDLSSLRSTRAARG